MRGHKFIRDEISDLLEPASPETEALGAWQDPEGQRFVVYDNRLSDDDVVKVDEERYSVEKDGYIEDFAYAEDAVDYVDAEAGKTQEVYAIAP